MKRAILLLVVFVGGAFYLGWFTFTTDGTGPNEQVHITIDKEKVQHDEARALQELHSIEQQAEARAQANAAAATNQPASPPDDRSADRRMGPSQRPVDPYVAGQPGNVPAANGYQPLEPYPAARPAPQAADPYELPERPRATNRQTNEEAADSFSRGFQ
ncbi:MAG TPA: hypothetical protein VG826_16690 [Pirellulales bacterium]|nr:hypothetical protein [Pirellulales bacterium]